MRRFTVTALTPPKPMEAVAMSGIYGVVTLVFLFVLAGIITPSADHQLRGWRRARKHGVASLKPLEDAATSFWFVLIMAITGAVGWYLFTRGLVESRWFPGHQVAGDALLFFAAVMLTGGVGFQALLEAKGGRTLGLAAIFAGVVPIMAGTVLGTISDRLIPLASWLVGISPLSMPVYAAGTLLSIVELPVHAARAVPRAFHFWLFVSGIVTVWLVIRLRAARKEMAQLVIGDR
jgi:hypothetical protein